MKKSRPVVSAIIPVYNGEEYLAEAIDTVFA
jgi:glycosyltransferase involved in cell wall biosynthesis